MCLRGHSQNSVGGAQRRLKTWFNLWTLLSRETFSRQTSTLTLKDKFVLSHPWNVSFLFFFSLSFCVFFSLFFFFNFENHLVESLLTDASGTSLPVVDLYTAHLGLFLRGERMNSTFIFSPRDCVCFLDKERTENVFVTVNTTQAYWLNGTRAVSSNSSVC